MRFTRRAALLVVSLLAACSNGKDSPPPPPPPTFTLSGTVQAAAVTDVDGDTADTRAPQTHNDTPPTAQLLPAAVTVGGWASAALDAEDWYLVSNLAAGQAVTLGIADWTLGGPVDLDLCLYTTDATPAQEACSAGSGQTETLTVDIAGSHYVVVRASGSASSYVLSLAPSALAAPPPDALSIRSDAEFVPGEVIVRFADGVLSAGAAEGLEARAASVGLVPLAGRVHDDMLLGLGARADRDRAFAALGLSGRTRDLAAEVRDPLQAAKVDTIAVVKALRRRPDVLRADLNYVHHPTLVPNDPFYARQWHLPLINLEPAWDLSTGSSSVIVAVVDTGVFLAHPDLSPRLAPGYDFILDAASARDGGGIDPNPDDPGDSATLGKSTYHGTHVAGTVAAATNNAAGVAGVSWNTRIMPIRVLGVGGGTTFDILNGVKWAAGLLSTPTPPPQRASVINLSLGCANCFSSAEQAAYEAVRAEGVVIVAAAGNEASSVPVYPASYAGVISVGAVDAAANRAPYSNFGPNVDIAAPGGDMTKDLDGDGRGDGVASTWKDEKKVGAQQAAYAYMQGTSMASPHVAGVVSLMMDACPTLTPDQVDAILAAGGMSVDLGAAGRDDMYGYGLLDARKAVEAAQTCGATLPTTLGVSPRRLDFGLGTAPLPIVVSKNGTGTLPAVTATEGATWLTVTGPGGNGLGSWSAEVDRTPLAPGLHSTSVVFTAGTSSVSVPVTVQVGGVPPGQANVGHVYVVLAVPEGADLKTVAEIEKDAVGGVYPFSFTGVPVGSYFLVAGSDFDNDGRLCDPGESCGAYPDIASIAPLQVSSDRTGLGFTVGYDPTLGAAAAVLPSGGIPFARPVEVRR